MPTYKLIWMTCAENRLLGVLGRDGSLEVHLPSTKDPIHYSADSQALISLSKMGNGDPNRNQTTWTNTDTGTSPEEFYEPTHNQKIAIREMGVGGLGAFNDFMERLGYMGVIKTRRRNGRWQNGIEIINPMEARRKQFGGLRKNIGFFSG